MAASDYVAIVISRSCTAAWKFGARSASKSRSRETATEVKRRRVYFRQPE